MTIGGLNPDLLLGDPRLDEPVDRGPYDRELWERCPTCGVKFASEIEHLEHLAEDADE